MSKIVCIDAGHGYNTAGKRCMKKLDKNETREWFLNDRIADKLEKLLAGYDCKVLRADDTTGKKDISLANRVKISNNSKADIYISIHHNAGVNGGTGGGIVVFYSSSKAERATQAKCLYNHLISETKLAGNRSQKVINKGFYVIKNTKAEAFLVELGFMDSKTDVPIILTEDFADKCAKGLLDFLVGEYELKKKTVEKTVDTGYYKKCDKKYTTISTALSSIGLNASFSFRKKIAKANNISGYVGTASQNTRMLNLLKAGLLKKA
jgi:N-acetylmuramoyl-L-alanine amidase